MGLMGDMAFILFGSKRATGEFRLVIMNNESVSGLQKVNTSQSMRKIIIQ